MKIIVLQGVPASGKSTWAKNFVKDKLDYVIVSRDSIRRSTGKYWVPEREDYISSVEQDSVKNALEHNLNVIIDATNLSNKSILYWKSIASFYNAEIEFKKFNISFDEAYKRDCKREYRVGYDCLVQFFTKYFPEIPIQLKKRFEQITLPQALVFIFTESSVIDITTLDFINTVSDKYQIIFINNGYSKKHLDIICKNYLTFKDYKIYTYYKDEFNSHRFYEDYIKDKYCLVNINSLFVYDKL